MPHLVFSDSKTSISKLSMGDTLQDINDFVYMVTHVLNGMYILANLRTGNCMSSTPVSLDDLTKYANSINMILVSVSVSIHASKRNI